MREPKLTARARAAIENLAEEPTDDKEMAHSNADYYLLQYLSDGDDSDKAVAKAYKDLRERCDGFWYA